MFNFFPYPNRESDAIAVPGTSVQVQPTEEVQAPSSVKKWSAPEKFAFRFFLIFFAIQLIPWDIKFYKLLFSINWLAPHFKELLDLVAFLPTLIAAPQWGILSFANWFIYLGIALSGAIVWSRYDDDKQNYTFWNYLLSVALRYKLALGLIAYGFYMLFQQHMPYPSLSNLHTNYGDLLAWKIYFQTTAINPEYQSFLGFVEILSGGLILYRRTVTLGTGLALGFLGNIVMVNFYYDVGEHVYSTFLLLVTFYLFAADIPRLYSLLVKNVKTSGKRFYPDWASLNFATARKGLIIASLLFVTLLGARSYVLYGHDYKVPQEKGLAQAYGYYEVTNFLFNGDTLAYSLTDPNRWQNVIFEKWPTISIAANRPITVDISDGNVVASDGADRTYEIAGAGGRHYYSYTYDTLQQQLQLQNKNPHEATDKWSLTYSFPSDSTIVLQGVNEKNDSIRAELLRIEKKYFMYEGRRSNKKL